MLPVFHYIILAIIWLKFDYKNVWWVMVMTHPLAYHPWNFLMKNIKLPNSGLNSIPYSVKFWQGKFWWITFLWNIDEENIDEIPLSNNILINYVNTDKDNFDELSKFIRFVKISPVRILRCTIAELSKKLSTCSCHKVIHYQMYTYNHVIYNTSIASPESMFHKDHDMACVPL